MKHFAPPGPLGFGGAPLGNMFSSVDEAVASAALRAAWQSGVRHFDTAPHYGNGLSEHRFGDALRQYPRSEFTLSTKVGRLLRPDPNAPAVYPFVGGLPFRASFDYSYQATLRSIEDSTHRLGLAKIDVVYIHDIASDTHGESWMSLFKIAMSGAARALTELRDAGVIRGWGLGVNLTQPCELALQESDPDVFLLAGRYSLLDQSAADTFFPACMERGVHVVIGGPFNSGLLAGGAHFQYQQAPPALVQKRDRIAEVCRRHGVDLRAAALQFCAAHPVVSCVIPGAKDPQKVLDNARLMQASIPPALWAELKGSGLLPPELPTPA
jgi:D-threo-aldose 1-dehydrogenase